MVLDRFRGLFREGKGPRELRTKDLPEYFSEQERARQRRLAAEVDAHRSRIQAAIDEIREILKTLEEGEQKMGTHPKLEKIGRSALPQLVRSLRLHINRTLPEDPESYYREAGNVLKGCIDALRGAGKYLPPLFPEEMKALRAEIRTLGQSINAMTASLSQFHEEERSLTRTTGVYQRLIALKQEREEHVARILTLEKEIQTSETKLEDIRRSLAELTNRPEYGELNRRQVALEHQEVQQKSHHLQSERIHGTVLSVYRRALRLARRHEGKETPALLEKTIEILESEQPSCEQIQMQLERSISALTGMIKGGDLIVKGQEESTLFGDLEEMVRTVMRDCQERMALEETLRLMRDAIERSPIVIQKEALEKEHEQLTSLNKDLQQRLEKEREMLDRFSHQEAVAKENLANSIAELPGEIRWIPD
jgi:hypothetical protein